MKFQKEWRWCCWQRTRGVSDLTNALALKRWVLRKDPDGLQDNFAAFEAKADMMTADG